MGEARQVFRCPLPRKWPAIPLLDHAFRVFSRLFTVPAAFFAIAGTGIIRTGLRLCIVLWSAHRFISACEYRLMDRSSGPSSNRSVLERFRPG